MRVQLLEFLILSIGLAIATSTETKHMDVASVRYTLAPTSSAPRYEAMAGATGSPPPVRAPVSEASSTVYGDEAAPKCVDMSPDCEAWASMGECTKNEAYMTPNCPAACALCVASPEDKAAAARKACVDKHHMCATWASIGECKSNEAFMKTNCRVSCAVCQSESCHDVAPDCAARAIDGGCYVDAEMKNECAFTCLACNIKSDARCARDRAIPPAAVPGSVDTMFKRIVQTSNLGPFGNGTVNVVSTDPWLITIDDFLSSDEADGLLKAGGIGWSRSLAGEGVSEVRTSSTAWCRGKCLQDPVVNKVQERVTQLTGVPTENGEFLQVLRYEEGQFYGVHSDQNSPRASAWGPRLYTVYMYLADVEHGGGTRFPNVNLTKFPDGVTVTPKKGRAALWASVYNDDPFMKDQRTDHEALPPREGSVKYGCNFWLHMYPFRGKSTLGCENALYAENWV